MMKIKVKKEMNLHQLIQWARENKVKLSHQIMEGM